MATLVHLMRGHGHQSHAAAGRRCSMTVSVGLALGLGLAGCSGGGQPGGGLADPPQSVAPAPDYANVCAPIGADTSSTCLRVTLEAIDAARAGEGLGPMVLPSDFLRLTVPEQLFVAIDRERVDRGLIPFTGLATTLDAKAQRGAETAQLPRRPGRPYAAAATEWIGAVDNGLDADYQWMYDDGPDSGVPGCSDSQPSGCWVDRHIALDRFGSRRPRDGSRLRPDRRHVLGRPGRILPGGHLDGRRPTQGRWRHASPRRLYLERGTGRHVGRDAAATPLGSLVRIRDRHPRSPPQRGARTRLHPRAASRWARRLPGLHRHGASRRQPRARAGGGPAHGAPVRVRPTSACPISSSWRVNLERVDRGLPPFGGLTTALDRNAQRGADDANDPPDPGAGVRARDAEWAGGSSNGLDAVYGWMYEDGFDSGNLDCRHRGAAGCWGHRKGILDDFGSGPNLAMGAALDPRGDTHDGDGGGTSMAVTLAVATAPLRSFTYSWAQVLAALPTGAP